MCGDKNWDVMDFAVTPTTLGPGAGLIMEGQVTPQLMAASPCGFIAYFSALKAGVQF
jgi:hypothetical protein